MLSMMAVTNKDYCMVNTLIATMPDGEEYVFDRDMTEYSINNGILIMNWYGVIFSFAAGMMTYLIKRRSR